MFLPDGKIGTIEQHNFDGSVSRRTHLYNDAGRLAESQFRMDDGPISKVLHSYDEAGRELRTVDVAPDGTRRESEICSYDSSGRKTTVRFLSLEQQQPNMCYGIEGTEQAYMAPGAATMTIAHDERHRPAEVLFHDASGDLVRRLVFTRDREGSVLSEEVYFGGTFPFADMEKAFDIATPEDRTRVSAMIAAASSDQMFSSTTYAYDQQGRLLERIRTMGMLGRHRTTFRYDDDDSLIEEATDENSRSVNVDDSGHVHVIEERVPVHHLRFEYRYDALGNWTERVVWSRIESNAEFQRSNVERRSITYYET